MIDRSISRAYRWKVQGRLAVLEYAAVHGLKPTAARLGLDRKTVRQGEIERGQRTLLASSRVTPNDGAAASLSRWLG